MLIGASMGFSCGSAEEAGPYFGPTDAGTAPAEAGVVGPQGNLLSVQCGPFGPSRLTRLEGKQADPHVVIADFNCDGHLDAVTGSASTEGAIQLHLGNGDGTFRDGGAIELGSGVSPVNMVAGDFNGDGAPDLVVAASASYAGSLLLYYGGSCGAEPWSPVTFGYPSPYLGTAMAVADMNGDGVDDLVLVQREWPISIDVLLAGNAGNMVQSDPFSDASAEGRVKAIAVGDFNGDGHRDVAAVTGKGLHLLLGDGTGALTHAAELHRAGGWFAVTAAALDDNDSDSIVAMSSLRSGETLTAAYDYEPVSGKLAGRTLLQEKGSGQIASADLDGDERPDLVVAGPARVDTPTELLLSKGDPARIDLPSTEGALALADLTGDGHDDLVYLAPYGLEVYPHLPACPDQPATCASGADFAEARYPLEQPAMKLLFGDLTDSGADDVVAVGESAISILHNNGSGQLAATSRVDLTASGVALANVEGDAADEIIAVDGNAGWTVIRGDGSWHQVRPAGFPTVTDVVAGDFNKNGRADLAFKASDRIVVVPDGNLSARFTLDIDATLLGALDFDGDGYSDLLLSPSGGAAPCLVRGPIKDPPTCDALAGAPLHALDVADFNGDGVADMTYRDFPMAITLWKRGNTASTLLAPDYGFLDARVLRRGSASPELLVVAKGGALATYASGGSGVLAPGLPVSVQQSMRPLTVLATHDLDGDGSDEIVGASGGTSPALWVLSACPSTPPVPY